MVTTRTISEFDKYIDEQLDKMGSDYFPLAVKLERFKGLTLSFIQENTKYFEVTQEVSENIQTLFLRLPFKINQSLLDPKVFELKIPQNLFRLGTVSPYYVKENPIFQQNEQNIETKVYNTEDEENTDVKVLTIVRDGEEVVYKRNPYKKPTPEYPTLTRYSGKYRINFGKEPRLNYNRAIVTYIKTPVFGESGDDLLVDLPDVLVEKIISKTSDALRFKTGDDDATTNFQFNETYSK